MARYDFATHRLFVDADLAVGRELALEQAQTHYLMNVLRMPVGGKLLVINGRDGEWQAELAHAHHKAARIALSHHVRPQTPASPLRYAFAPLKSGRLDYMVQKAVEMGAGSVEPVLTRRTQVTRLGMERIRANAIEAMEQCGVLTLPQLMAEMPLERWLAGLPAATLLVFCDEEAEVADPLAALAAHAGVTDIALLIGPEGGFTPEERSALLNHPRLARLSLGPRILRADTAAVAALAIVQAVLGDWRSTQS